MTHNDQLVIITGMSGAGKLVQSKRLKIWAIFV